VRKPEKKSIDPATGCPGNRRDFQPSLDYNCIPPQNYRVQDRSSLGSW